MWPRKGVPAEDVAAEMELNGIVEDVGADV